MAPQWNDIRLLADMIEAESEGREIDRRAAEQLAARLAQVHPEIGASMGLVRRRMAGADTTFLSRDG